MRVDIIHQRDPDYGCAITVYLDGVSAMNVHEWDFDPGAGTEMDTFEENKQNAVEAAPDFLKPVIASIYDEMKPVYEKWSY